MHKAKRPMHRPITNTPPSPPQVGIPNEQFWVAGLLTAACLLPVHPLLASMFSRIGVRPRRHPSDPYPRQTSDVSIRPRRASTLSDVLLRVDTARSRRGSIVGGVWQSPPGTPGPHEDGGANAAVYSVASDRGSFSASLPQGRARVVNKLDLEDVEPTPAGFLTPTRPASGRQFDQSPRHRTPGSARSVRLASPGGIGVSLGEPAGVDSPGAAELNANRGEDSQGSSKASAAPYRTDSAVAIQRVNSAGVTATGAGPRPPVGRSNRPPAHGGVNVSGSRFGQESADDEVARITGAAPAGAASGGGSMRAANPRVERLADAWGIQVASLPRGGSGWDPAAIRQDDDPQQPPQQSEAGLVSQGRPGVASTGPRGPATGAATRPAMRSIAAATVASPRAAMDASFAEGGEAPETDRPHEHGLHVPSGVTFLPVELLDDGVTTGNTFDEISRVPSAKRPPGMPPVIANSMFAPAASGAAATQRTPFPAATVLLAQRQARRVVARRTIQAYTVDLVETARGGATNGAEQSKLVGYLGGSRGKLPYVMGPLVWGAALLLYR